MESKTDRMNPPGELYRLAWAFYLVLSVAGVVWVGLREGAIPASVFVDLRWWWLDLGIGVGAGALLLGLWVAACRYLDRARELERFLHEIVKSLQVGEVVALACLSGFAEEFFFRGAVQGSLGWVWASLLFAVLHCGPGPAFRLWTLYAGLAGLLFAGLVLWRGNLLAPILAHTLFNGVNLYRLSRPRAARRLAGSH